MVKQRFPHLKDDLKTGRKYLKIILIPALAVFVLVAGGTLAISWVAAQRTMSSMVESQFNVEESYQDPKLYADTLFLAQSCFTKEDYKTCDINENRTSAVRELWGDVVTINGVSHLANSSETISEVFKASPASEVSYTSLKHEKTEGEKLTYTDGEHKVVLTFSAPDGRIKFSDMEISSISTEK